MSLIYRGILTAIDVRVSSSRAQWRVNRADLDRFIESRRQE